MPFADALRAVLETQERKSVGISFGGHGGKRSFSVPAVRDAIVSEAPYWGNSTSESRLRLLQEVLSPRLFRGVIASLVRFSFLIELTDLKVGSTKMKTRWMPGFILMSQLGSFEPVQGSFEPGNDQRAATFEDCLAVFDEGCRLIYEHLRSDPAVPLLVEAIGTWNRPPYEFLLGYQNAQADPVHRVWNIQWIGNDDIRWLVQARSILGSVATPDREAIQKIESKKLEVKAYKTDRALTGKDKTNRAKRWEVLSGDFQHATLPECWSVERKLTHDLIYFQEFPDAVRQSFITAGLMPQAPAKSTRCPVTLAPLNYRQFASSVLAGRHGRSDYQIGHLNPLKRGGRHVGENVCWQSADGNRIQGDLTIQETNALLDAIAERRRTIAG